MPSLSSLCVFCGSSAGLDPSATAAAVDLGTTLARRDITLVSGGGAVGLMGVVADACLDVGGRVVGVIPEALAVKEVAHAGLTELLVVPGMHERKAAMADRADGFVALPGGLGTLEELFEVWTWGQLGYHRKPLGLLDVGGFFERLLAFLDHTVGQGFVSPVHRDMLQVAGRPEPLLDALQRWEPPPLPTWLTQGEV